LDSSGAALVSFSKSHVSDSYKKLPKKFSISTKNQGGNKKGQSSINCQKVPDSKHYKMGFEEVKIKTISCQVISQSYLFLCNKCPSESKREIMF